MRILVTGGAGFIGSNLCRRVVKRGDEVIAVDNFITSSKQNLTDLLNKSRFHFYQIDITKDDFISRLSQVKKIDQIYHLACPTGVPNIGPLAEDMLLTSSLGTRNILELAKKHHAKVLFTSSSEVYGDPQVSPQTEDYTGNVDPIGARSPYEEGKRFAESLISMYVQKYQLPAKIVRLFNTYGPLMSAKDARVIPKFLQQALLGKSLTIHGQGLQRRTFLFIDDLIDGLNLVMEKGRRGQVYNLGSDQEISIIELAQVILNLTKTKSKIKFIKRPAHDHNSRFPALLKITKLGWHPRVGLREGLKKTIKFK